MMLISVMLQHLPFSDAFSLAAYRPNVTILSHQAYPKWLSVGFIKLL